VGTIIPKEISLILFSLIWLHVFTDNAQIDESRKNMLKNCELEENRMFLRSLLNVETFNQLLKNVTDHKDKILSLCKPIAN
jgi:hypothetical protein